MKIRFFVSSLFKNSRFTNIISFNGVFEASFHARICAIKNTFMHFVTPWKMSKNGIHNIALFMVLYHYMKTIWEIKVFFIQTVYEIKNQTFHNYASQIRTICSHTVWLYRFYTKLSIYGSLFVAQTINL